MKALLHTLFTLVVCGLFFSGCGTKRHYYTPEAISGKVRYDGSLPAPLVDSSRQGATLANGQVITPQGLQTLRLPQDALFLTSNGERYVGATPCGKLSVVDAKGEVLYAHDFGGIIASATLKGDLLAVVLGSNTLMLVDINNKKTLFSRKQDRVFALDSRLAAPHFLGDLIVYPTLDGQLVIVDLKTATSIRDVVVSHEKFFGNILFLNVLGDRLVAATQKKVVSISPQKVNYMDEDVKDIIVLENRLFVFTKDGRVVLCDSELNVKKERKFTFASFAGTIYGNFVYMIEKSGYILATDVDLMTLNVYKLPDAIEDHLFTTHDTLFYGSHYFKLNHTNP